MESAGFHIIILARNGDKIEKAIRELKAAGIHAEGHVCDISDERQLLEVSEAIKAKHEQLDFLLLNAGVVTTRLLKDYTGPAAIRKDLEINLLGVMFSAHFFAPMLNEGFEDPDGAPQASA